MFVFFVGGDGTRALFCIIEENLLFTSTIVYRKSLLSGKQRLIATAFKRECKERERERKSESESERKSESESERASEETVGIIILRRAISDILNKKGDAKGSTFLLLCRSGGGDIHAP